MTTEYRGNKFSVFMVNDDYMENYKYIIIKDFLMMVNHD